MLFFFFLLGFCRTPIVVDFYVSASPALFFFFFLLLFSLCSVSAFVVGGACARDARERAPLCAYGIEVFAEAKKPQ